MSSRLTALAALFAVLATATLTFAVNTTNPGTRPAAKPVRVIQLERVEVTGHRLPKVGSTVVIATGRN